MTDDTDDGTGRVVTVWVTDGTATHTLIVEGVTDVLVRTAGGVSEWLHVEVGGIEVHGFPMRAVVRWHDTAQAVAS